MRSVRLCHATTLSAVESSLSDRDSVGTLGYTVLLSILSNYSYYVKFSISGQTELSNICYCAIFVIVLWNAVLISVSCLWHVFSQTLRNCTCSAKENS